MSVEIGTERLLPRLPCPEDVEGAFAYLTDREVMAARLGPRKAGTVTLLDSGPADVWEHGG